MYIHVCVRPQTRVPDGRRSRGVFRGVPLSDRDCDRACFQAVHFFAETDEGMGDCGPPSREFEASSVALSWETFSPTGEP